MNKKLIMLYIEMVELNNDEESRAVRSVGHRLISPHTAYLCTECRISSAGREKQSPPRSLFRAAGRGEFQTGLLFEEKVTDRSEADEAAPMD
jgi:hypothetical protein